MNAENKAPSGAVKAVIVIALVAAVGAVLSAKSSARSGTPAENTALAEAQSQTASSAATQQTALPRLVDLGADKCVPCKMMAPILEELKEEYKGRMEIDFIDVWKNEDAGKQYGVSIIPAQIFYVAGIEAFRHEGFFSKQDILAKWKELGVEMSAAASAPSDTP